VVKIKNFASKEILCNPLLVLLACLLIHFMLPLACYWLLPDYLWGFLHFFTFLDIALSTVFGGVSLQKLRLLPSESQLEVCREVDRVLKKGGVLVITMPYREKIVYTRCIHCGKLTPLWGHLHSMDEERVSRLLPPGYTLVAKAHFPNLEFISTMEIFRKLPFTLWFVLNNLLGIVKKGYWILLKYRKSL